MHRMGGAPITGRGMGKGTRIHRGQTRFALAAPLKYPTGFPPNAKIEGITRRCLVRGKPHKSKRKPAIS